MDFSFGWESVKLVVEHVSLQEPELSIYQTLVYEDIPDPFDGTDFLKLLSFIFPIRGMDVMNAKSSKSFWVRSNMA